jgi:hypothetical protein
MHRGMRGSKINQAALSELRASRLRSRRQRLRQVDMTRERDRSELSRYVDQHRTAVAPPDRPCPPQEAQDQGGVVYKVASPDNVDAHFLGARAMRDVWGPDYAVASRTCSKAKRDEST